MGSNATFRRKREDFTLSLRGHRQDVQLPHRPLSNVNVSTSADDNHLGSLSPLSGSRYATIPSHDDKEGSFLNPRSALRVPNRGRNTCLYNAYLRMGLWACT